MRIAITSFVITAFALGLSSCSPKPSIEGKYRDSKGIPVEFLADGTVIIQKKEGQAALKWSKVDENRLKIEDSSFMGIGTSICRYDVSEQGMTLSGCNANASLTRL